MSFGMFRVEQNLLRRYFSGSGLQGWGDPTQPTNIDQLRDRIPKILGILEGIKERVDRPVFKKWQLEVKRMRATQHRIGERKYIQWIGRMAEHYKRAVKDIERLHPVLVNTIRQLAPYVSAREEDPVRHQTISSILDCLDLIKELLIPITEYTELRDAHPFFGMSFAAAKHQAWHYEDHLDELGLEKIFYPLEQTQSELKRVFDEENLQGWGTRLKRYAMEELKLVELNQLDDVRQRILLLWNEVTSQEFKNFWLYLDRMAKNPDSLMSLSQIEYIYETFWNYQTQFHDIRMKWAGLHDLLQTCAPYLSPPLNSKNPEDVERKRFIEELLHVIARIRVLLCPFIIVIKGLPFILTGELPQTVDYDSDE